MIKISKQRPDIYIPYRGPGVWLTKALKSEAKPLVHPSQFDRFIHGLVCWVTDSAERDFQRVRLLLDHPTRPSAGPIFEFFKGYTDPDTVTPFKRNILEAREGNQSVMLWNSFIRTGQLLAKEGRVQDARWVLNFARERRPDLIGESATMSFSSQQNEQGFSSPPPSAAIEYYKREVYPAQRAMDDGAWTASKPCLKNSGSWRTVRA